MSFFSKVDSTPSKKNNLPSLVPNGLYKAILKEVIESKGRAYNKGQEDRQILKFVFYIPSIDAQVQRSFTKTLSPRGALIKSLYKMTNNEFKEIEKNPERADGVLKMILNKEYEIQVQVSESGLYSNVIDVTPLTPMEILINSFNIKAA